MNYNEIAELPKFTVVEQYVPEMEVGRGAHESEAQLEKRFIQILESQGYEYLNTLTQEDDLVANLRKQMEKLNHVALDEGTFTDGEWERFYKEILANKKDRIVENSSGCWALALRNSFYWRRRSSWCGADLKSSRRTFVQRLSILRRSPLKFFAAL